MTQTLIDPLHSFIESGQPVRREEVPDQLEGTDYVKERLIEPTECPTCNNGIIIVDESEDTYEIRCHSNHFRTVEKSDRIRYLPSFHRVLQDIAGKLKTDLITTDDSNLPRYVIGETSRDLLVYLVYSPRHYEDTVKDIYEEAIERGNPSILITPKDTISDIVELQFLFSTGHLVQAALVFS